MLNVVTGPGRTVGQAIAANPRIAKVAFTGETTSGRQIMQAAALVDQYDTVTDDDIDAVMSANLCRCGTYPRIRAAVKQASEAKSGTTTEAEAQ